MSDNVVIYHAGCWDGFCAAWLFYRSDPEALFIPAQYGDAPPPLKSTNTVFVLDFSYQRDVLIEMSRQVKRVVVLDHHKTARDELESLNDFDGSGRLSVEFDMSRSGAHMTWDYLKERNLLPTKLQEAIPWLVQYTEDRDLWKWQLPDSKEVNAALRTYPLDFSTWDDLFDWLRLDEISCEGSAVLRYKTQLVAQHVRFARLAHFGVPLPDEDGLVSDGISLFRDNRYTVPAVNCSTADLQSEVAGELAENHDFGAVWVDRGDQTQLWSLRSREGGIDVGELAKTYGGGGHPRAAGFVCNVGTISLGKPVAEKQGL